MDDRRRDTRVDTNIEIVFREKGSLMRSYMLNVSNGGLFIKTDQPLPIESMVNLQVQLPDDPEVLDILGRVVWVNPKGADSTFPRGMGIQFVTMSAPQRDKIMNFVSENRRDILHKSIL